MSKTYDTFKEALINRLKTWSIEGEEGIDYSALLEFKGYGPHESHRLKMFDHLQYSYGLNDSADIKLILDCLSLEINVIRSGAASSVATMKWMKAQYGVSGEDGALLQAMTNNGRVSMDEFDRAMS